MTLAGRLALLFVLVATGFCGEPETLSEVKGLVEKLAHPDFDMRYSAKRRLLEIGAPALPALREVAVKGQNEIQKVWAQGVVEELDRSARKPSSVFVTPPPAVLQVPASVGEPKAGSPQVEALSSTGAPRVPPLTPLARNFQDIRASGQHMEVAFLAGLGGAVAGTVSIALALKGASAGSAVLGVGALGLDVWAIVEYLGATHRLKNLTVEIP